MKILNIPKNNYINNFYSFTNVVQKFNTVPFDSVSFTGFSPSPDELAQLKVKSDIAIQDAQVVKSLSQGELKISKSYLKKGQELYDTCTSYIEMFKKNPNNPIVPLDNGNILEFKFLLKDEDLTLDIIEYSKDKIPYRKITARDFKPTYVMESNFISSNSINFKDRNNFTYSKGISVLPKTFGKTSHVYFFKNRETDKIFVNKNSVDDHSIYDFIYTYKNNQLSSCYEVPAFSDDGELFCEFYYNFFDDNLVSVRNGFSSYDESTSSWQESFHYNDSNLVAYLKNATQEYKSSYVNYENAVVRLNSGNYMNRYNGVATLDGYEISF